MANWGPCKYVSSGPHCWLGARGGYLSCVGWRKCWQFLTQCSYTEIQPCANHVHTFSAPAALMHPQSAKKSPKGAKEALQARVSGQPKQGKHTNTKGAKKGGKEPKKADQSSARLPGDGPIKAPKVGPKTAKANRDAQNHANANQPEFKFVDNSTNTTDRVPGALTNSTQHRGDGTTNSNSNSNSNVGAGKKAKNSKHFNRPQNAVQKQLTHYVPTDDHASRLPAGRFVSIRLARFPCLSSSKHHAVCIKRVLLTTGRCRRLSQPPWA